MDVGEWLKGIGLGQYEATFRAHDLDVDVLPDLTGADLEKIGLPLGARKRLMKAIANLGPSESPPARTAPEPSQSPPSTFRPDAERRPITVMFCDLVGSTSLAARLDAEDWRDLVSAYLDAAEAAVAAFGGHVLKRLGDGLMALFGYPQAQENDAERAVRAALAVQRALAEFNVRNAGKQAPELSARIGLDMGPVVVDAKGEVFGEAPNVAARVQAAAEPGAVLVTASVQRHIAGLFVAEDRGAHELKGVPAPVALYRIVRASGGGRRGRARAAVPLVGRAEELALLMRRWERTQSGQGQFVQIVGEPGIGKSRLLEEFHARLGETPHTWVEFWSSQLLQNTSLHPVAEWGRQRFGDADTPAAQRFADLENTLQLIGLDPAEHAPLVAPLVDIPLPPGRAVDLPPEELRRRQLAALIAWFLAGARSQPVAIAFEDLHWADPTSLDLMKALAERGAQAPLLILATTRPEFRAPWSLRAHHSVISLTPLARADVAEMVGQLAARHALSKEVVDGVSERTGGVPLFVEEVTRLLLERGEAGGLQAIPPTLQQSLAARLDRLGPAREVAQIGAVLGRDFSYALLRAVAAVDDRYLQSALDRLAEADLLIVEGAPPRATYRFKHALIQDAAYDSLLKSRRQALHRRAAEILRDDLERAAAAPEVIAHHFTEAGLDDLAIEWWGKAGDQALRRSAFQEAIAHLGKAIAMADKASGTRVRGGATDPSAWGQRLKLQTDYGQAVMWSKGFAAQETGAALARAAELAAKTEGPSERFATYVGQMNHHLFSGEFRQSEEVAERFLREAESAKRWAAAAAARFLLGVACLFQGKFSDARKNLERTLADWSSATETSRPLGNRADHGALAAFHLALVAWATGDPCRARSLSEQASQQATGSGHTQTTVHAYFVSTVFEVFRNDPAAAFRSAEDFLALARQNRMELYAALAQVYSAWARNRLPTQRRGVTELREAVTDYVKLGNKAMAPSLLALLAKCEADAGNLDAAGATIDEALLRASESGERWTDAFLHRIRGEILLRRNPADPEPAQQAYQAAIAIAREQSARSYELLASLALAKLYQSTGRASEAHAILAPALEGFAPTPEMPEIAEAQALLTAVAECDEVRVAGAQRERRLHLQTAYGQAIMMSRGFAAEETKAAFVRATELAAKSDDFAERFAAAHGRWTLGLVRGELRSARELASAYLEEAEEAGRFVEVGVARRGLALACQFAGDFVEARTHCERALEICDPDRDRETRERFGDDTATLATACLAITNWQLGEVERARELIDEANRRAAEIGHAPSLAHPLNWKSTLEVLRGDAAAALAAAEVLDRLGREHAMPFWSIVAQATIAWARGRLGDAAAGAEDIRRALAVPAENGLGNGWFNTALLAEVEEKALGPDNALARIDEALATARCAEYRCDLAFPHRLRGEILLRRDPPNLGAAEDAFRIALAIAREQGARSWVLRAALSLAKLYQSTARPAEAHAVLAPALEGFAPTPEMPEIAEAQALLAALAASEPVAAELRKRETRSKLHAGYALATMMTKGFGAEESKAALVRAASVTEAVRTPHYWTVLYGRVSTALSSGDHKAARDGAEAFLAEAEALGLPGHGAVARRLLGFLKLTAGELAEARADLMRALADCDERTDENLRTLFGSDHRSSALILLAAACFNLGDIPDCARFMDEGLRQAKASGQPFPYANALFHRIFFLSRPEEVLPLAEELRALATEQGLKFFRVVGSNLIEWARVRLGEPREEAYRAGFAALSETGNKGAYPFYYLLLADVERNVGRTDAALCAIERGLTVESETGQRWLEPWFYRLRGETLRESAPEQAEAAYREAISMARSQGARLVELFSALSLAKLYQSTGRPAEAHAVLAPALEGFAPTPEMPEIAEAQALLAALAETDEVRAEAASRQHRLQLQTNQLPPAKLVV
jgi:class 3 adenylate cyclase/predicted ATPase